MEEKLQQLKESMSKEKEERGHSSDFRWKSGQCGPLNSNASTDSAKRNKENILQKLSAGKVKIRVLKDEPLTAPAQPLPPAPPPTIGLRSTRKHRLRGTACGQCEVKSAGLMCAECTENYCVGCFTRFHQKGALKLHRIIPIQLDLQTHVSTPDVVSCFQKDLDSHPRTLISPKPSSESKPGHTITPTASTRPGEQSPQKGAEVAETQVLRGNDGEQKRAETIGEGPERKDQRGLPSGLLRGEYNEEESARSFLEALRQWRGEKNDGAGKPMSEGAMWTPVLPVSVSAMATQTDLAPDRGAERRVGGGMEPRERSLPYMDRLLLKKHRRSPIEMCLSLACDTNLSTSTEEETASELTAQEEDFRHYCASLFAVPVSSSWTEITRPESCLVIEALDESDGGYIDILSAAEKETDNNRKKASLSKKVPSAQQVLGKGRALAPRTAATSGGSSRASSPRPTQSSRESRSPSQLRATQQQLRLSESQTSQPQHEQKASSKSKPSACPTAGSPRTTKTSIRTPTSASKKPNCSPAVHKSKPICGSPQLLSSPSLSLSQTKIPESSRTPDVSPPASAATPVPEEHMSPSLSSSFSLRSTFTVSPSGSIESTFLPRVDQLTPLPKVSDSSLLLEQSQSTQLFPECIPSPKLSPSPPSNLEPSRRSQRSFCDLESLRAHSQLQLPMLLRSASPNPPSKSLEPSSSVKCPSSLSLFNDSPADENPPSAVKTEEEEDLSADSGDEMSSDSLGLASQDSSGEEAQVYGRLTRGRSREEARGNLAISHLGDPFVPAGAEIEKDLSTDEQEQLSEPSMVLHKQSAGSGSEQFCDLDWSLPPGLDTSSGHSDTPEHTHCDTPHACQTSPNDLNPTGSEAYWPSGTFTDEHLLLRMKDTQPRRIQIHSTTPTRRGETPANELGTSGSNQSGRSTPSPSPSPASSSQSRTSLGQRPAVRPLSRAAQEIMEICSVDEMGCEDPDLDSDATAHTLSELDEELRLMAEETGKQASVYHAGSGGSQDHLGNHHFTRGRVTQEQKDEEEAERREQESVLSLP